MTDGAYYAVGHVRHVIDNAMNQVSTYWTADGESNRCAGWVSALTPTAEQIRDSGAQDYDTALESAYAMAIERVNTFRWDLSRDAVLPNHPAGDEGSWPLIDALRASLRAAGVRTELPPQ